MDIYGEALDSIYFADQHGHRRSATRAGSRCASMLDWLADNWDQPGEGIWETRGGQKDFTYGRVMSWVAFDRAIRLAAEPRAARPTSTGGRRSRDDDLPTRSWTRAGTTKRGAFVQHYGDRRARLVAAADGHGRASSRRSDPHVALDAAARWTQELVTDSLVYRYDPAASPDGLAGDEGTFSLCTFNYVDALARAGRLEEARLDLREDADLRQPPRPVLRGDRAAPASSSATSRRRSPTSR